MTKPDNLDDILLSHHTCICETDTPTSFRSHQLFCIQNYNDTEKAIQAYIDKKVNEAFSLPVPYTLTMKGDGSFIATWKPEDPIKGLPEECHGTSSSEGHRAINMLYLELVERGVIKQLRSEL